LPGIATKMFRKKVHTSKFIETHTAKNIRIIRKEKGAAHHDGEPAELDADLTITVTPACLKVVVNENFKG